MASKEPAADEAPKTTPDTDTPDAGVRPQVGCVTIVSDVGLFNLQVLLYNCPSFHNNMLLASSGDGFIKLSSLNSIKKPVKIYIIVTEQHDNSI